MSNPFTPEQIHERFESLPDDIQTVISAPETAELIESIGRNRGLRIDKIGALIEYSGLIMLGFIKSNEFVNNLAWELQISKEQAESLAVDIDSRVFSRMRSSLRQVQYQSTADKSFDDTNSDEAGESPVRDSLLADIEKAAAPSTTGDATPVNLSKSMSSANYDHQHFTNDSFSQDPRKNKLRQSLTGAPTEDNDVPVNTHADTQNSVPDDSHSVAQTASTTESVVKDFKEILEAKIKSKDNPAVHNDPYRESV